MSVGSPIPAAPRSLVDEVPHLTDAELYDRIREMEAEIASLRSNLLVEMTRRAALQLRLGMMARGRPIFERRN